MKPEFSVIIAIYNKEQFLKRTLQSVLDQDYAKFEVILVNDGSTDGSKEVIDSFSDPRIKYFEQENQGASAARNRGIKEASKPYLALLDADDHWQEDHLSTIVEAISMFPEESVFSTNSYLHQGNQKLQRTYTIEFYGPIEKVDYFEASLIDSVINSSTVVLKKSVFDQVSDFNVMYESSEDTDLWIRLGAQFPVIFSKKYTVTVVRDIKGLSQRKIDLAKKLKLNNYRELEQANPAAKKFLDLNRYALALKCKLQKDWEGFQDLKSQIDPNNLNFKQASLLGMPRFLLKLTYKIKGILGLLGLDLSAYK